MKWKCPKKTLPSHKMGNWWSFSLAPRTTSAESTSAKISLSRQRPTEWEGGHLPSAACPAFLISWPFAQGFCHLQIARAREDLSREGVGKGSHDGAEGRGKVAGSVGKIHKHIIERGRNFLCTGSSITNGAKLSDACSVRANWLCMG